MEKISIEKADRLTSVILEKCHVTPEDISIILKTMHYADQRGISTHGIGRLPLYVKKICNKKFNPMNEVEVIQSFGATTLLDAHNGFGQIAADEAMRICIQKAKEYGVAVTGVRNSNNFGTAGYFGRMAAERKMAAIIFANAAPAIAPTGGKKKVFGTNPICFACPGDKEQNPIVLDMATTVAARGKIRLAQKNGEKIPLNWAVDQKGKPTDDPAEALLGSLLPIGGYKGYGLSLFIDLFAGLLTGSAFGGKVSPLSNMENESKNGHFFITIDIEKFLDWKQYTERIRQFILSVKESGDSGCVFLPGELGNQKMQSNADYIYISEKQINEINNIAELLNIKERLDKNG